MKAPKRSCSILVTRFELRQTINVDLVGSVDEPEISLRNFMMVFDCLAWRNHISEAAKYKDFISEFARNLEFLS